MSHKRLMMNVPVFKISYNRELIYFNAGALPLLEYWKCLNRQLSDSKIVKEHPEIFETDSMKDYYDVNISYRTHYVRFRVVPFPEAGYIGFYGDPFTLRENIVRKRKTNVIPMYSDYDSSSQQTNSDFQIQEPSRNGRVARMSAASENPVQFY